MNRRKAIAIVLLALAAGYATVLAMGGSSGALVNTMALALLPVLSGMLIGAVGVYLGSLGILLSALHTHDRLSGGQLTSLSTGIQETVDEVKADVLLSIGALAGAFVIEILIRVDVPGVRWPLQQAYLEKDLVLNAVSLSLVILTFVAVIDCVRVMFALHAQYSVVMSTKGARGDSSSAAG